VAGPAGAHAPRGGVGRGIRPTLRRGPRARARLRGGPSARELSRRAPTVRRRSTPPRC
jgi:hypothetical protein